MKYSALLFFSVLFLSACGNEDKAPATSTNHIYEKEIETLNQAKKLQKEMNKKAQQSQQRMDEINNQ